MEVKNVLLLFLCSEELGAELGRWPRWNTLRTEHIVLIKNDTKIWNKENSSFGWHGLEVYKELELKVNE